MTSQQDTTKLLIEHVRARLSLWDPARQSIPGIKKEQQKRWTEIAKLHGTSPEEMKKKWQSLRASFSKLLKRSPKNAESTIRWPYFEDMMFLLTPPNVPSMSTSKKIKTEKRQLEDTTYTSSPSAGKRQRSNVHENEVPFANANEILSTNEGTSDIEENDETRKSQSSNVQDTTGPIENSVEECSFSPANCNRPKATSPCSNCECYYRYNS